MIDSNNKSVAFLIDSVTELDFTSDSTLLIANELQNRCYRLFYFLANTLTFKKNNLYADGNYFRVDYQAQKIIKLDITQILLQECSVIFMRHTPPINQQYLTTTYLVEKLHNTLILNHPDKLRGVTEKLSILQFKSFIPNTIVSSNPGEIKFFIEQYENVVLKPLYDCGGKGVIKMSSTLNNLDVVINDSVKRQGYVMVQEYLSEVVKYGDKRVLFLNGKILGVINRKVKQGDFRVNMRVGGKAYKTYLTQREKILCQHLEQFFKDQSLFLVGVDIINEKLIEINVTSPTGLVAIKNLYNIDVEKIVVDEIETSLKNCYSKSNLENKVKFSD